MTTAAPTTRSNPATYVRLELLRTVRNTQSFAFSLILPAVLYLAIAGSNRHVDVEGISFPRYYMVSMAGYGAMIAALSGGARIAAERSIGWNRQLRLTPLRPRTYFLVKIATGYMVAAIAIAVLYVCGLLYGVRIDPVRWAEMTGLLLIGLVPFAAIGILIGHLLKIDAIGPAMGGMSFAFGFLGGQWFPLGDKGTLVTIAHYIPSYWLTQASHVGIGANAWGLQAWLVLAAWTAAAAVLAARLYARDTKRA
jgi:ABC-2 type transport system permease protein